MSEPYMKMWGLFATVVFLAACAARPIPEERRGPRSGETGRFRYADQSQPGLYQPCHFCLDHALSNSQFSYMQVSQCSDFYVDGEWTDLLSDIEVKNGWIPICNEGPIPGCGPPPFNITNTTWMDEPDHYYFGVRYSVYSLTRLRCDLTGDVIAGLYCNESLLWHTDFRNTSQCQVVGTYPSTSTPLLVGLIGGAVAVLVIIVVCVCVWKSKKRSPSRDSSTEEIPFTPIPCDAGTALPNGVTASRQDSIGSCGSLAESFVPDPGSQNPEYRPLLLPPEIPGGADRVDDTINTEGIGGQDPADESLEPKPLDPQAMLPPETRGDGTGIVEGVGPTEGDYRVDKDRQDIDERQWEHLLETPVNQGGGDGAEPVNPPNPSRHRAVQSVQPDNERLSSLGAETESTSSVPGTVHIPGQVGNNVNQPGLAPYNIAPTPAQSPTGNIQGCSDSLNLPLEASIHGLSDISTLDTGSLRSDPRLIDNNAAKQNQQLNPAVSRVYSDSDNFVNHSIGLKLNSDMNTLDIDTFEYDEPVIRPITDADIRGSEIVLDNAPRLDPATMDSNMREDPAGESDESRNVVERGRDQMPLDDNPDVEASPLMPDFRSRGLSSSLLDSDSHRTNVKQTVGSDAGRPMAAGQSRDTNPPAPQGDTPRECPCITHIKDVTNVVFHEKLSHLGDPETPGNASCFYGLGQYYGMDDQRLKATRYHRRGHVGDGPMRFVVDHLGHEGYKLGHIVSYFAQHGSTRYDIVCHIVDDSLQGLIRREYLNDVFVVKQWPNLSYLGAPSEDRETLANEQFMDALVSTDMRLRIKQARPTDLNDAVRHAVELEAFYRAERRYTENQGIVRSMVATDPRQCESCKRRLDVVNETEINRSEEGTD